MAAYVILGINSEGRKEVLTIQIGDNESSKYWLSVLNELKNRGVKDILILCADGLTGIKEAIAAAFNGQKPMTNRPTILVSIDASGITASSYLAAFMKIVNGFAELSIPDQHIVVTADSVIGQTEVEIASLVNTGFILRNPIYIHTQIVVNGFGLSDPTLFPAMVCVRDGKMYLTVYSGDMTATNGSTIKFCGIGEIAVPLWQIN